VAALTPDPPPNGFAGQPRLTMDPEPYSLRFQSVLLQLRTRNSSTLEAGCWRGKDVSPDVSERPQAQRSLQRSG
jgi:hypothetical protein